MKIPFNEEVRLEDYIQRYLSGRDGQDEFWKREEKLLNWQKVEHGRKHITKEELITLAEWKSRYSKISRGLIRVHDNSLEEVKEKSSLAFAEEGDTRRLQGLMSLSGVSWAMASCILHFAYDGEHRKDRLQTGYPILDIWAITAVSWVGSYTLRRWEEYVKLCREAADANGVSMRKLDQALWAYGEEQGRS